MSNSNGKIVLKYHLVKLIGQGRFGKVYESKKRGSPHLFAVKEIIEPSDEKKKDYIKREIEILKEIKEEDHFLLKIEDNFQISDKIYIVTKLAKYGSLTNYMKNHVDKNYLDEKTANRLMKQLLIGLSTLQKKKIMHRDINPENILVDEGPQLWIADFGLAKKYADEKNTIKLAGNPCYSAPETFNNEEKNYGLKADIWSLGLVYYFMLFGKTYFEKDFGFNIVDMATFSKAQKDFSGKNMKLDHPHGSIISEHAKNLLQNLVEYDKDHRASWKDVFKSPIFDNNENAPPSLLETLGGKFGKSSQNSEFEKSRIEVLQGKIFVEKEMAKQEEIYLSQIKEEESKSNLDQQSDLPRAPSKEVVAYPVIISSDPRPPNSYIKIIEKHPDTGANTIEKKIHLTQKTNMQMPDLKHLLDENNIKKISAVDILKSSEISSRHMNRIVSENDSTIENAKALSCYQFYKFKVGASDFLAKIASTILQLSNEPSLKVFQSLLLKCSIIANCKAKLLYQILKSSIEGGKDIYEINDGFYDFCKIEKKDARLKEDLDHLKSEIEKNSIKLTALFYNHKSKKKRMDEHNALDKKNKNPDKEVFDYDNQQEDPFLINDLVSQQESLAGIDELFLDGLIELFNNNILHQDHFLKAQNHRLGYEIKLFLFYLKNIENIKVFSHEGNFSWDNFIQSIFDMKESELKKLIKKYEPLHI